MQKFASSLFALLVFCCMTAGSVLAEEIAVMETAHGTIKIKFFPKEAPNHVVNFKNLAKKGFLRWNRFPSSDPWIHDPGGDPNSKSTDRSKHGTGGPGHSVKAEFNSIKHERGILSMARSSDPNSAGSQFFIVVKDSFFLDGQYTVFGKVISGMDVADKIVAEPRDARDNPLRRVAIKSIKIVEK